MINVVTGLLSWLCIYKNKICVNINCNVLIMLNGKRTRCLAPHLILQTPLSNIGTTTRFSTCKICIYLRTPTVPRKWVFSYGASSCITYFKLREHLILIK